MWLSHRHVIFLKLLKDQPIHCQMPEQKVKAVNFDFCKKPLKLIGYHSNVPWATVKLMSVL